MPTISELKARVTASLDYLDECRKDFWAASRAVEAAVGQPDFDLIYAALDDANGQIKRAEQAAGAAMRQLDDARAFAAGLKD